MTRELPDDWHEVEDPDYITEKYRATNPTLFVREGHDVGVHVLPVSTSSPHDEDHYRVGAVRGGPDEFEAAHPIQRFGDLEPAFAHAIDVAHRYDDEYDARDDEERALDAAVAALS